MHAQKFHPAAIQKELERLHLDGWLAVDFQGRNEIALEVLGFAKGAHITRRWFYWVPKEGIPLKVHHAIEGQLLTHLEGACRSYISYGEFCDCLKEAVGDSQQIALEYSPMGVLPALSLVDGGVVDLIRSFGVKPLSSQEVLQRWLSALTPEEIESQRRASVHAEQTMGAAWEFIGRRFKEGKGVTERDVQQFILESFAKGGFITEWDPIVAVNDHSALPHYSILEKGAQLKEGDFLLIDLGCKEPKGIYSDITRVACVGRRPSEEEEKIFDTVRGAQKIAFDYIRNHPRCRGADADAAAREFIQTQGYGPYFLHRLGHNITTRPHGPGAHLDSLETLDTRPLIENSCFSVEPGIYLPGRFGIRQESTVLLLKGGRVELTGGVQDRIHSISV